ncbi:N-succinyl-L,L-diaminopimelate aminotransferase, type 2 [hydrothermal vent metagenome]|uniref:N-succinyl-L,L-diaminopimelate aminotransferase, type 2 n=1 Tax=hydrothermal vent metagenome TaxID=652676 RepID=A0A3B0SUG2_9ZZZZ
MRINPVLSELGEYKIAAVKEIARALQAEGKKVIDFSIGDPREPTPAFITDALHDAIPAVSQYPAAAGLPEFREAVADYVQRRFGVSVDPDTQIVPTSGSKEAVFNTPFAFCDPGANDVVVYGSPGYPIYERGARFAGAEAYAVELSGDFVLRHDDIPDDIWSRTRLVWTCTPHNPTGAVTSAEDLDGLLSRCRANDALLLSDECYMDVYEEEHFPDGPTSTLQVAGPGCRGALVYLSLSKRSGMTGYRSGAIVGDPDAIAVLKNLRSTTGTAAPEHVQRMAVAAWGDDVHAEERRDVFAAKRAVLRQGFEPLGYKVVASQAGLYLWIAVGDDLAMMDRLLQSGVVVSAGRFFGAGGEGYIRLALVPTLEDCAKAAEVVRTCLSS